MFTHIKPDYQWWVKKDYWSIKEASLLLHEVEPLEHRSLRLNIRDIPPEWKPIQKTYFLLDSVPWQHRYEGCNSQGINPRALFIEAVKKELSIPEDLRLHIAKRFEYEQAQKIVMQADQPPVGNESLLSTRERHNLLKCIGLLVKLLLDTKLAEKICTRGNKPSAVQLVQLMLAKADDLGLDNEGIKSLDRKITEALELIAEESVTTSH